ncbi:NAD(P)-dependent oxidoreductase [Acinetobacter sp. MD2(2019)]|uniref:NAD(P)-dependent oxidoreductase n=1 Tax=Acinetobacter sp. MD2(2019) TaxID=2605273 RepID=UPI002D1F9808|nr:NAD(P)-dependent oxidoreductase [Acinetobacter sp. MD2(2019)]MEB3754147.1 D-2-hydroxyacid dehydrogenase [Acinetobacter sp. MD2(2019)]
MNQMKVTCVEKYVLLDQKFTFDFPVEYTEHQYLTQQEFEQQVHDQDIIIVSDLIVTDAVLKNNPNLKLLALCSTGYNHVDLVLMKQHDVRVCNIRGYAGDAVAEHAFTFMINLIKQFPAQVAGVEQNAWAKGSSGFYLAAPMRELQNKTLVILGKGEIGLSLAKKAQAFGMQVIFSERQGARSCREGYVPFDDALAQADILSLHCELNAETRQFINADVLAKMKAGSLLINVGRGGLVDQDAVIAAIESGHLAGYGADVLDQEPPPVDHPLVVLQQKHPNVMLTGHVAWATDEAQQRLFDILQNNVNAFVAGQPQNVVA